MYSIIIFIALYIIGYSLTKSFIFSFIIALLFSGIVEALLIKQKLINPVVEGMTSKREKKNRKTNDKLSKSVKKMLKSKKFPKGKYTFDAQKSYKKTYDTLSNNQLKGLKKDTKDLVKTQQQLMSTLKEMGPVLEQGKSIIGAFDSFFGDAGKNNDLAYMTKRLGIKK
jgi:hydroxymethylpyrimidine pyrophosphatase-like HAD family hydrolase